MNIADWKIPERSTMSRQYLSRNQERAGRRAGRAWRATCHERYVNNCGHSLHMAHAHQLPSGGFRPRNTLNTSNAKHTFNRDTASIFSSTMSKALQVESIRGGNVKNVHMDSDISSGFTNPPVAKRRKVDTVSIDSSSNSDQSSDDPIKMVPPGNLEMWSVSSQSLSLNKSTTNSQGSKPRSMLGMDGSVSEYMKVEKMMNSSSKSKRQLKRERSNGSPVDQTGVSEASSPLLGGESKASQTDNQARDDYFYETSVNSKHKQIHSGTAEISHVEPVTDGTANVASSINVRESSPLRSAPHQSLRTNKPVLPETSQSRTQISQQAPMSKQFVADDGKRRGEGGQPSSPDELMSETTVGKNVIPISNSPSKRSRRATSPKPSAFMKTSIVRRDNTGLDPSNIRPTNFGVSRSVRKPTRIQEVRPPYSLDIAAINLPGNDMDYRDDNLGLVHDESQNCYVVIREAKQLTIADSVFIIDPKKLLKVFFEEDGRRIRFQSARKEDEDNILDIEIAKEKDKQEFLTSLQANSGSGLQIHPKARYSGSPMGDYFRILTTWTSETMEKWFQMRRKQPKATRGSNRSVAPASVSRFPGEISMLRSSTSKNAKHEAQARIVSELVNRASEPAQTSQENLRSVSSKNSSVPSKDFRKQEPKILQILHGLKPEPLDHNSHLRRSARTSGLLKSVTKNEWDDLEERGVMKYSKVHGLGKPWKKPLTYPKIGRKKATVEFIDLERLDEGEFLNDTLVTFHMRFLEHQAEQELPELAKRIHFFSTFFYQRLTDFTKGTKEINYAAVQNWTRNVDIFTYDYIVVPINESAHWYLAIICNLPALDRKVLVSDEDDNEVAEASSPVSTVPPSQGPEETTVNNSETVLSHVEDPAEKGARESFADLNLDARDEQHLEYINDQRELLADRNPKHPDDEMLDGPGENNGDDNGQRTPIMPLLSLGYDPIEDPDPKPKAPAPSKRNKRKSLPPITHIDPMRPLIITFDSLGAPHGNTIRFLKDYLLKEMDAKRGPTDMDIGSIRGINAKCIPQQNNFSDCGLYMLGYLDKFMEDGPSNFIAKTIKREYRDEDWSKLVPSKMRANLRDQLLHLGGQHDEEIRAAKAERRKADGGSSATSPITSSAPSAIGQAQTDPSSKPTSSRTSPAPLLSTRRDALATAQPISEANNAESTNSLSEEEHGIQRTVHYQRERSGSNKPLNDNMLDEASLVIVQSQSRHDSLSETPSSQMPESLPKEPLERFLELPSEVEDSQDPAPTPESYLLSERASKRRHRTEDLQDQTQAEGLQFEVTHKICPIFAKSEASPAKQVRHTRRNEPPHTPDVENNTTVRTSNRSKSKRSKESRAVEIGRRVETLLEERDVINID